MLSGRSAPPPPRRRHLSSISLSNVFFCVPIFGNKTGPARLMGQHCMAFKKEHSPIHFWGDKLLRSSEKWECCAMSSLMWPWPERMFSRLKLTKLSRLAVVQKKTPQPSCLSRMVLILMSIKQKRKRQAGPLLAAQNSYFGGDNWRKVPGGKRYKKCRD